MKRTKWITPGVIIIVIMLILFMIKYTKDIPDSELLQAELIELESMIVHRDILSTDVSQSNVAWHLDHTLKVINNIYDTLKASDPDLYESDVNMARAFVWSTGRIPRGRGQAPDSALPPDSILTSDIHLQLEQATENIRQFSSIKENQYFLHPVFGNLDKKDSKRLLVIHTQHHLLIIKDIIEKDAQSK